jgi:transcriptional regulator with XRE-family HTH domain
VVRASGCLTTAGASYIYPSTIALLLDTRNPIQYHYSKLVCKGAYLEALKDIRRRHGLSQEDLSSRSGVAQNTISDIETGRRDPRPSTLRKLAKSLGVEVADFYPETSRPKASAPSSPEEWLREHGGHLLRLTDAELRREFRELPAEDRRDFMERLGREFGAIQTAYERESEPRAAVITDAHALASGRFLLATELSGILKAYFVEEDRPEQVTMLFVRPRPKDILERLEEYLAEQEAQEAYERNP